MTSSSAGWTVAHRVRIGAGTLVALIATMLIAPQPAAAATVTVCASGCDQTTIGDAIAAADPGDTITIAAGTYTEMLTIDKDLTLQGAGQATTIIQAHALPDTATGKVIEIVGSPTVTIDGVTVRHGNTATDLNGLGGGIENGAYPGVTAGGQLTIANSTITNNRSGVYGGGISNYRGTLTVTNSTISNNTSFTGLDGTGGGIANIDGDLTVTASSITGNTADSVGAGSGVGGGIWSVAQFLNATATVTGSTISGNTATNGGGVLVAGRGAGSTSSTFTSTFTLAGGSSITSNVATYGAGMYSVSASNGLAGGDIGISHVHVIGGSTIDDNTAACDGGGIWNSGEAAANATVTITSSTIADNAAGATCGFVSQGDGGGIWNVTGTVTATDSTISGNTARDGAGVLHADLGVLTVTGSAITGNAATRNGGGIWNGGPGSANVSRSALTGNSATVSGNAIHQEAGTVTATLNWWGVATGPPAGAITGTATSDPWLASVGVSPSAASPTTGTPVTVTATLRDNTGADAGASPLLARFTRTGSNPGTADVAFASTAPHVYTGTWGGVDTVTAAVLFGGAASTLTGQTTINWQGPGPELTSAKSGAGAGTVTSDPAGINCGATCDSEYLAGTAVELTAVAASGSIFTGWSGSGCSGTGTCTVSMTQARTVTAAFALNNKLTTAKSGSGAGTVTSDPAGINCGGACEFEYLAGTAVELTAVPAPGSSFTGWLGSACSGTGTCTVNMSEARTVTAAFGLVPVPAPVPAPGSGADPSPSPDPEATPPDNTPGPEVEWRCGGHEGTRGSLDVVHREPNPDDPTGVGKIVVGTPGDDVLAGTPGDDIMCGQAGADVMRGLAGDDDVVGGRSADEMSGGRGADELRGGSEPDVLRGGRGSDELFGGAGADHLFGGPRPGRDFLRGGRGFVSCFGRPNTIFHRSCNRQVIT